MPYVDNDGVRIRWEEEGSGEPLLLIMGLGYSLEMWHRVKPLVTNKFRVIMFDNRGVGQSDVPEPNYSIPDMADDAVAVLDAAGVESAHVLGVSMGGYIAQALTIADPDRVRSLILGCTACGGPDAVTAEPEVLAALTARGSMSAEEGVRVMIPFIYDANTSVEAIDEDLALRLQNYPTEKGYMGQLQAIASHQTYDRLHEIVAPTLVIHGQSDRLVPHANGEDIARRIPNARFVTLPDASHIFFTDQPERTRIAIDGFLAEVASVGAEA